MIGDFGDGDSLDLSDLVRKGEISGETIDVALRLRVDAEGATIEANVADPMLCGDQAVERGFGAGDDRLEVETNVEDGGAVGQPAE